MTCIIAQRKNPAVDLGVQRLDAPVHHLREACVLADFRHRYAGLLESRVGTAGRKELNTTRHQTACEVFDASFVGNTNESAAYRMQCAHEESPASFLTVLAKLSGLTWPDDPPKNAPFASQNMTNGSM